MVFFNVDVEQMFAWEVLVAFKTPISMGLVVMDLIFVVGSKGQRLSVRRQVASHGYGILFVVDGRFKLSHF